MPARPARLLTTALAGTIIVVFLLLVLAAVPAFTGRARPLSEESAAIQTLRAIWSAQNAFRSLLAVDVDADGRGENGSLAELAGTTAPRHRTAPAPASISDPTSRLTVPLVSPRLGQLRGGRAQRAGYLFELWLPSSDGDWINDAGPRDGIDPDLAEQRWCAYAWPERLRAGAPQRALFIDESGVVRAAPNVNGRYCGASQPVRFDAAFAAHAAAPDDGFVRRGRDAQDWIAIQ